MERMETRDPASLNYNISTYLLRGRYRDAEIHCGNEAVLESLRLYMASLGIPSAEGKGSGIRLRTDMDVSGAPKQIVITAGEPDLRISSGDATVFVLPCDAGSGKAARKDEVPFDLDSVPLHLKDGQIRDMFLKSFTIAEQEIDIISPWMNFSVVNASFVQLMRDALARGVRIRIIYGLDESETEYNQGRSSKSDRVAGYLRSEFSAYGDSLRIVRDNIHYKLVLCDEKFKLEGGFNYLSFTGDYSVPGTRREGSPFGRDVNEIRQLRKEYFDDGQI